MDKWCKIFEVNGKQILFYWEFDSIEDVYVLHQIYKTGDGLQGDMALSGDDLEWVKKSFNKIDQKVADKLVNYFEKLGE